MHSDESYSQLEGLRNQVRDLAFELPAGDPTTARLHLLLMGLVQELGRLDNELAALAEDVLGDRRYSIKDEHHDDAGSDGGVPRPTRAPTVADRHARV